MRLNASMPFSRHLLLSCCMSLFILSCTKDPEEIKKGDDPIEVAGEVCTKGTELETPKTAVIGASGGKLTSTDGLLEINVPSGAVSANTEISVARITNTSSSGFGLNYRLTPHINFQKPVTLTFSYQGYEDKMGMAAATGISYQDEQGVWQLKLQSNIDTINKKISVTTDHFSDWSLTSLLKLTPAYSEIRPNESVTLTPYVSIKLSKLTDLAQLFKPGGPDIILELTKPYKLPSDYVIDIFVPGEGKDGIGTLSMGEGSSMIYRASSDNNPPVNPVTITYILAYTKATISAKVKVLPEENEGMHIKMGGKEYHYTEGWLSYIDGKYDMQFSIEHNGVTYYGSMAWNESSNGNSNWSDDNQFNWEPEDMSPRSVYQSFYNDGLDISAGHIEIYNEEPPKIGDLVYGAFVIDNAGITNTESGNAEYLGHTKIEGVFTVRRTY